MPKYTDWIPRWVMQYENMKDTHYAQIKKILTARKK